LQLEKTFLEIIYQDEVMVIVNKPTGLLVHRSPIAADASEFAIQVLRDQIGQKVFPVHRLDRKTSGLLVFALNEEVNKLMQVAFMNRAIEKKYLAIVRGFVAENGTIDYALTNEAGKVQDALTHFRLLQHFEIEIPNGKFSTARYSLVEVEPETGRMHQIRKHFAHVFHPIIGDRPHGCNKQNKLFLEKWGMNSMLLHASELTFKHPLTNQEMTFKAPLPADFNLTIERLSKKD
jgi:tRNA pseudouridine65 synthase